MPTLSEVLGFALHPDNIPILVMAGVMVVFSWLSYRDDRAARRR